MLHHAFAYLFATPISGLLIGVSIDQAYRSRPNPLKFIWGSNAVLLLTLASLIFTVKQSCNWVAADQANLDKFLLRPTISHIVMPAITGCVELLVQIYFIQTIRQGLKTLLFPVIAGVISFLGFVASWACTINIVVSDSKADRERLTPPELGMPTFYIGIPFLATWLGIAAMAQFSVLGGQLYVNRYREARNSLFNFQESDSALTRIAVTTVHTSFLSAALLVVIAGIFMVNLAMSNTPTPVALGAFVFLNLVRTAVGYFTLIFCLTREHIQSPDILRISLTENPDMGYHKDEAKKFKHDITNNHVTIHTVRSQIIEL